ncbi:unnamed protein product [Phaedon cochleariae]|uniref:APCDD1 domain-containing protein n=1 Tax=Phaedon cochleariae TaxID=80249 RepID=A0A9P0GRV6_PHACE|nr:unnamed protein product [Phaedon cochleariae]
MLWLCWIVFLVGVHISSTSQCGKLSTLASFEDHKTIVETSLNLLAGSWISEGCEIRPGPEYILRSYTFDDTGKFQLIQHHYWDDSCTSPQLSVIAHGRIQLRDSLVQPGAANAVLRVGNVTVVPQDDSAAKELDRVVAMECPGRYWKPWRRYEEHTIYDSRYDEKRRFTNLWASSYDQINQHPGNPKLDNPYFSDITCLGSLKWAFNELKLLKIQLRPILDDLKRKPMPMKMELLLGDIHSNFKLREYYNPTSFQVPLIKRVKDDVVFINRHSFRIKNPNTIPASIFTTGRAPPHLIEKPHLPPYVWGEWTSTRCEVRPMGLYLTRRFSFFSEDSTWIGDHKFYSDPFCKIPKFIVTAAGHFALVGPNKEMKGTTDIDFHIERASLTVLDQRMIHDMRLQGLCGLDQWKVNVPKELSSTNGCAPLGISLPSVLKDVVKLEMDYRGSCMLFLGQVDTDGLPSASNERPSAFQLPLVRCGDVATYSQSLRDILNKDIYHNGVAKSMFSLCSIILLMTLSFFR